MFRAIFLCAFLANSYGLQIVNPGPANPPTKGEIWPQPQQQNKTLDYFTLDLKHFEINATGRTCRLLEKAMKRYKNIISHMGRLLEQPRHKRDLSIEPSQDSIAQIFDDPLNEKPRKLPNIRPKLERWIKADVEPREETLALDIEMPDGNISLAQADQAQESTQRWSQHSDIEMPDGNLSLAQADQAQKSTQRWSQHSGILLGTLQQLNVILMRPCEEIPYMDMIESYDLNILSEKSVLKSSSIWGILRGLESFSQLLYYSDDFTEIRINATKIMDFPRYAHRGLLLDTSRHYISLDKIFRTIETMAYNKMNVFHWHIVDDQSFPYVSRRFPNISANGAYYRSAVYQPEDVAQVVRHARDRGIRVVPEFDVPGHTRSWGEAFPQLLTECYDSRRRFVGLGPMNPIKPFVYTFLTQLFQEVSTLFPDKYMHVGGDEVDHDCWLMNPKIAEYMEEHNMTSYGELHELFMSRIIAELPAHVKPIVWQEVVDSGVTLPADSLVQIWKSEQAEAIMEVIEKGYRVLYSTCWYLDHVDSGGDWTKFYSCDPREMVKPLNRSYLDRIVGGEACMWGEVVDDNNLISRVWPRASAAAEKLWSAPLSLHADTAQHFWEPERTVHEHVVRRLEEHVCRMQRRGIHAQPASGPGYCRTR